MIEKQLDKVIKECWKKKFFHSFEYRCYYDIEFTNITSNEQVILTITQRSMEFKTEFYGLNKKIKSNRETGFIIIQKKLTIKV